MPWCPEKRVVPPERPLCGRLIPACLRLPKRPTTRGGQVVVTSGDVLLRFRCRVGRFQGQGDYGRRRTLVNAELAKNHGVYCPDEDGKVRLFLQKPSLREQARVGSNQLARAIGPRYRHPEFVSRGGRHLLELCGVGESGEGRQILRWEEL
ncbi:MAG: hypothetical protein M0C28_40185 [Candidatus Moduliflexus flocculans]|nr:hypothetical protein [Candidatus Moduliflexus flocculans]